MKKTLRILLAAVLCIAMLATLVGAEGDGRVGIHHEENRLGSFVDAPEEGSWKYQGLNCAVQNGVMNGHENKIRPDDNLTRAEMVAMMVRVLGAHASKADIEKYVDIALNAWYYDSMQSGVAIKIINGSGNKMMPTAPITREQTFTILARTFLHTENDKGAANKFNDAKAVSDWAKPATNALIESGVVLGDSTNTLRPKSNVTRAEFAAMLDRIACYIAKDRNGYAGKKVEGSVILNDANINLDGAVIEGDLYITDAVGGAEIDLSNVTVTGRIVIRGGEVSIKGDSSASQVVVGNPTNNATVKAEDTVKVDKVVVAENSNDVKLDVSANEVVINSSSSEVTINKDTTNVTVSGADNHVKVESGAKVENVVVNGENTNVSGSGNVGNATINGSGSTVTTPNTNVTDNTPSKPSTPVVPPVDDKEDDKPAVTPGSGSAAGGSDTFKIISGAENNGTWISYGPQETKLYAKVSGSTITFDLSALEGAGWRDITLHELCVVANKTVAISSDGFSEVDFDTNEEKGINELLGEMLASTSRAVSEIIGITDAHGNIVGSMTLGNLADMVESAYIAYEGDASADKWLQDLFDDRDVSCIDFNIASFKGTINGKTYTVKMIVPEA